MARRGDRPTGCAWRRAGDRKILKSISCGDGGAFLDLGDGEFVVEAVGGLGGVATKRPRASVAAFCTAAAGRGGVCGVAGAASGARVASASLKRLRARSSNGAGSITRRHSMRSAQSSASRVLTCVDIKLQAPHAIVASARWQPNSLLDFHTGLDRRRRPRQRQPERL